jgi:ribosomal-protein-alanine N-acetyltransferase
MTPLGPTDLDLLVALETRCAAHPWSRASLASALALPHTEGWRLDDRAYLFGQRVLDEAEIHSVGVVPGHRRQGLARQLVDHALVGWRSAGVRAVHLEVRADNAPARALYTAAGFATTGRRRGYYGDMDALLMTWSPVC